MRLRVANVIEEGKLGGPQVRIVRVAAALKDRIDTLVIMPDENSHVFREQCATFGVAYCILPMSRITKEWKSAIRYVILSPREVFRLRRTLIDRKADLVHVSGGSWQYKGVIAAKLAGIPIIWHLNDTSIPALFRGLFYLFGQHANGYIFASHRSREYYGSVLKYSKLERVIPAPVDAARFDPANDYDGDAELVASWGDALVIGTVANVNPIKGLETLIRAAAELKDVNRDIRFVVVGPVFRNQQTYYQSLLRLSKKLEVAKIDFVGARIDVRPLLKRFDIFACSSLAESSPVSVWEAMAMARPVVSTDVGDVRRHVHDRKSGFVVGVGDHKSMADRFLWLAADPDLRRDFGKVARREACAQFSPIKIAGMTEDFYCRVINAVSQRASKA